MVVPFPEVKDPNLITAIVRPFQPMVDHHFNYFIIIGVIIHKSWQVWFCIGLSLVVLSFTLTFVSGFYDKYIGDSHQNQLPRGVVTPLFTLGSFGTNAMAVLSHLTNHGCKFCMFIRYYYLIESLFYYP